MVCSLFVIPSHIFSPLGRYKLQKRSGFSQSCEYHHLLVLEKIFTSIILGPGTPGKNTQHYWFELALNAQLFSRYSIKATTWPSREPGGKPLYIPAGTECVNSNKLSALITTS